MAEHSATRKRLRCIELARPTRTNTSKLALGIPIGLLVVQNLASWLEGLSGNARVDPGAKISLVFGDCHCLRSVHSTRPLTKLRRRSVSNAAQTPHKSCSD